MRSEADLRLKSVALSLLLALVGPTAATELAANVEEARLEAAARSLPDFDLDDARLEETLSPLRDSLREGAGGVGARNAGTALWRAERDRVRSSAPDDRGLYWRRLAATRALRAFCAGRAACVHLRRDFELASRGVADLWFDPEADTRILITGFDPFDLDSRVDQSNPSGLAALLLDETWIGRDRRAQVQALVLPVRFADFDEGLVEHILGPLLTRDGVDLLVTVSMGREGFDLERFPGRRRSATAPDNQGVVTGASPVSPVIPRLGSESLPGPEFVEFSLPADRMLAVDGPYPVRDNRTVATLERGEFAADSLASLAGQTSVRGSGGGYLSNEVSFRSLRLAQSLGSRAAVGHLHTPRVRGYDPRRELAMVEQIEALLEAALDGLD